MKIVLIRHHFFFFSFKNAKEKIPETGFVLLLERVRGILLPPDFKFTFVQMKSLTRSHGLLLFPAPQAQKFRSTPLSCRDI